MLPAGVVVTHVDHDGPQGLPSTGPRTRSRPLRSSATTRTPTRPTGRRSAATTTTPTGTPACRRAIRSVTARSTAGRRHRLGRVRNDGGATDAVSAAVERPTGRNSAISPAAAALLDAGYRCGMDQTRSHPFQGTFNFRDVGGYAGRTDARRVAAALPLGLPAPHRRGRPGGVRRAGRPHGARPAAPARGRPETGGSPAYDGSGLPPPRTRSTRTGATCRTAADGARALAGRPLRRTSPRTGADGARAPRCGVIADPDSGAGRRALRGRQGPHRCGLRADPVAARRRRRGHRRRTTR